METIRRITIDLYRAEIVPVVKCKQFDTGRRIGVRMTDNGKVFDISGSTLRIFCKKADGKLVYNNAEVVSDNEAIFCITSQMTAATGKLLVEIEIVNGDDVISTPIVLFDVLPSNISDSAIESTNEFVALNDVIKRGEESIETMGIVTSEAEAAEKERKAAESARKTAETKRVNADNLRETHELDRKTAEANRDSAETARNTAEQKRQSDTTSAIQRCNTAISDAEGATQRAIAAAEACEGIIDNTRLTALESQMSAVIAILNKAIIVEGE
ncbi:BppU family phage baseplate upper protein [Lachnospiraceae bacterium ASD3451]|uniref:BppU family phage baseplate upper protein n=1 Tax=Diplocloster agilis TaxID=2850323 RepID=UPI001DD076E5|nr:BppU family phage baseplate upper protein [Diplocloster agilis]MBU9746152.1 BppU family phage baseplate upper protein [Diplocloster agilis]